MTRKYDLLAISLLIFSTVLVMAISMDPKGFALSTWQPLMAAVVALGGAGIVYRGAMLSYDAALQKVDLDRQIHQQEVRRRVRGVYLRTSYAMHLLCEHSAQKRAGLSRPPFGQEPRTIDPAWLPFREEHSFDEAWNNLEVFPGVEAFELRKLKVAMLNFNMNVAAVGDAPFQRTSSLLRCDADEIDETLAVIEQIAKSILRGLERHYLASEDR